MSSCANASSQIFRILDLPLELFQRIVREAILVRGITRGMRLRLVNRKSRLDVLRVCPYEKDLFADEAHHVLFLYNMLDERLSLEPKKRPPFTATYLEHRVTKEPVDGNPMLLCIRQIAARLTNSSPATPHYIASLCELAAPNTRSIFRPDKSIYESVDKAVEKHLRAAAIYMGHLSYANSPERATGYYIFGSCPRLVATHGSTEMVGEYLERAQIRGRCYLLARAAQQGRLEMVRFIFNYRITVWPWRFDRNRRVPDEFKALGAALRTPNPEVWDYIVSLHGQYGIPVSTDRPASVLATSARQGWTEMTKHLLAKGTDPNIISFGELPLFYAAQDGHTDVAKSLIEWGAKVMPKDVVVAALKGHVDVIRILLDHNPDITGALVGAARGGNMDIVRLLLDHGADVNEDRELPAIGYAIINEHTAVFRCLLQHGAKKPTRAIREAIESRARKAGVESMLALLNAWDVGTLI